MAYNSVWEWEDLTLPWDEEWARKIASMSRDRALLALDPRFRGGRSYGPWHDCENYDEGCDATLSYW